MLFLLKHIINVLLLPLTEWLLHFSKCQTILQNTHQTYRNADDCRFHTNLDIFQLDDSAVYTTPQRITWKKQQQLKPYHTYFECMERAMPCHTISFVEKIFTRYQFVSCTVIVTEWTLSLSVKPRTYWLFELHQHCVDNLLTLQDKEN